MPTRFAVKGRNINADNKMNFNFITSRVIFHCCSLSMEAVYLQLTLGTFFYLFSKMINRFLLWVIERCIGLMEFENDWCIR